MGKDILAFVARGRRRLNSILLAARGLRILIWAGLGGSLAIALVMLSGLHIPSLALWVAVLALSVGVALIFAMRDRLDTAAAALWLDRRLALPDLLTSAVAVLERGAPGRFDGILIEQASGLVARKPEPVWPLRALLRNAVFAALSLLAGFALLFFVHPGNGGLFGAEARQDFRAATVRDLTPQAPAPQAADAGKRAEALAKLLFPKDADLARRAADAIARGDAKALDELLDAAGKSLEQKIKDAKSPEEKKALEDQKRQRDQVAQSQALRDQMQNNPQGQSRDEESGPSEGQKPEQGQGRGDQGQDKPGQQGAGAPDERQKRQDNSGGGMDGRGDSGSQGDGRTDGRPAFKADLSPTLQDREIQIGDPNERPGSMVLSEQGPRIPLGNGVSQAEKSAEAAVSRSGVPVSYEEFVRAYFAALGDR